jgi:predicted RNase H-like HicB family nuclease
MKSEFTAIIEASPEGGFWAICPEISGANGQGETVEDAKHNLIEAIQLTAYALRDSGVTRIRKE